MELRDRRKGHAVIGAGAADLEIGKGRGHGGSGVLEADETGMQGEELPGNGAIGW